MVTGAGCRLLVAKRKKAGKNKEGILTLKSDMATWPFLIIDMQHGAYRQEGKINDMTYIISKDQLATWNHVKLDMKITKIMTKGLI